MGHFQLVDANTNDFLSPTLSKHPGKASYGSIRDTHCLLTVNAASVNSSRNRVQNGHLRIALTTTQYNLVSQVLFSPLTDPGHTHHIPEWTTPFNEEALLHEHAKQLQQYNKCRNVDTALRNQLLTASEDTYLSTLKNAFTDYSGATMLTLLSHMYTHYARIFSTDLAEINRKLQETYNLNEPLESLYTRLNECVDYATLASEPITKGQVVRID